MYRLPLLIIFVFSTIMSFGQDISGTWRGNYGKSLLSMSIQKLEVDINLYNDSLVRGTSHLYYNGDKFEHYEISGWYHKEDSTIYFSEDKEIAVKLGFLGSNVMGNYTMKLSVTDTMMRLEGKWKQNGTNIQLMATKVWLEKPIPRKRDTIKPASIIVTPEVKTIHRVPEKSTTEIKNPLKVTRIIEIDNDEADSLVIEITDNARIDNDRISVYLDDQLLINNQVISHTPIVLRLSIDKNGQPSLIRMVAKSYGSMPPCTARMSIITPKISYIANMESSYNTDAAVMIKIK